MEEIKLTQTVSCGGCAAKINPIDLYKVLSKLPHQNFKNLLVGYETGDDACVFKLNDETSLIFTTDFIAPVVDNPYDFGKVAATNALSDIYAMGGKPIIALNIMCFDEKLGNNVLQNILLGGADVCKNANTILGGGHTVKSPEIRYGLAVIGQVHPDKIISNSKGKIGDTILLTKPLGTGILSQALKHNLLTSGQIDSLTAQLCQLNDKVADAMQLIGIECATDITGFGLLGHLHKLLKASSCGAKIIIDQIPALPNTLELVSDKIHSGIVKRNREFVQNYLKGNWESHPKQKLLFDPQTSGGIMMTVSQSKITELRKKLNNLKIDFWEIGSITKSKSGTINII